jgi:MarR family transcriptional regulator for hemolysin
MNNNSIHERFGMALVLLHRLYRRDLDEALKDYGLTEASALPLQYLAHLGDDCRQGVLAEAMNLEGPSLVRVIDQLVTAGFVERQDFKDDKRAKIVRLTESGRALNEQLRQRLDIVRDALFENIPDDDVEAATATLKRVIANTSARRSRG